MKKIRNIIVALCSALLANCAVQPDVGEKFTLSDESKEFCDLLNIDVHAPVNELLKPYGKPNASKKEIIPNRHNPNAKDEIHTFSYGDGIVSIYSVPHINRNYMFKIVLTDKFWPSSLSKHTDKTADEVKSHFGNPNKFDGDDMIYFCAIEVYEYFKLNITDNKVESMEIKAWID